MRGRFVRDSVIKEMSKFGLSLSLRLLAVLHVII